MHNLSTKAVLNILVLGILISPPLVVTAHTNNNNHIVSLTDDGFIPQEIIVEAGETIRFINETSRDFWPASDFHPTHDIYPEFDPQNPIKPDASWIFTFDKVGSWNYHDHLSPHLKGHIIINQKEPVSLLQKVTNFFLKLSRALAKVFTKNRADIPTTNTVTPSPTKTIVDTKNQELKTLAAENPKEAWQKLKSIYITPEGVAGGNPHDMAHLIGGYLFEQFGLEGLTTCNASFAFGCYHGLLERALVKQGVEHLKEVEKGCEQIQKTDPTSFNSCIHGIGHGLATFTGLNLKRSLDFCDTLESKEQHYCEDGVFMEYAISAPPNGYKRDALWYPCTTLDKKYGEACARNQATALRTRFKMSVPEIASTCIKAPTETMKDRCLDVMGYNIGQEAFGNATIITNACKQITDETAQIHCMISAAVETVFQNYRGWQETTKIICGSIKREYQNDCTQKVDETIKTYNRK